MSTKRHCDGCGATQGVTLRPVQTRQIPGASFGLRLVEDGEPSHWLRVAPDDLDFCSPKCAAANVERAVAEAGARAAKAEDDFVKFAGRYEPRVP